MLLAVRFVLTAAHNDAFWSALGYQQNLIAVSNDQRQQPPFEIERDLSHFKVGMNIGSIVAHDGRVERVSQFDATHRFVKRVTDSCFKNAVDVNEFERFFRGLAEGIHVTVKDETPARKRSRLVAAQNIDTA